MSRIVAVKGTYPNTGKHVSGFTLIELVIVIVLLGLLAAFALPRFANLGTEARVSSLEGVSGAMKSAASIVHMACRADAECNASGPPPNNTSNESNSVVVDGELITLAYGYPRHTLESGIQRATNIREENFQVQIDTDRTSGFTDVSIVASPDPDTCKVRYQQPQSAGEQPTVELTVSGC